MLALVLGLIHPACPPAFSATSTRVDWQHLSSKNDDLPSPEVGCPTSIAIGDVDRDGANDFVIAGNGPPSVVWYRWTRKGWQRTVLNPTALSASESSLLFDIDQDADLDLLLNCPKEGQAGWWWKNPSPQFRLTKPWKRHAIHSKDREERCWTTELLFADYDGNHVKDLLYWEQKSATLCAVSTRPSFKSQKNWEPQILWTSPNRIPCRGLDLIDIDLDGRADLVGGGYWLQWDSAEGKLTAHRIASKAVEGDLGGFHSVVGDFVSGGRPEVVMTPLSGSGPLSLYQWLDGAWKETVLLEQPQPQLSLDLQVADIDGDENADFFASAVTESKTGDVCIQWIFYGDGQGGFRKELLSKSVAMRHSRLGDLDNDGDVDIVSVDLLPEGNVHVWLNRGTQQKAPIPESPLLDIWYGDEQHIGQLGTPQPWVNVLGTVSAESGISELTYSLNEGPPQPLSMGPNLFRLSRIGDFNADISRSKFREGPNVVRIMATDALGNKSHRDVTFHKTSGKVWPLPYAIDWSQVENIQDVVEVADGRWKLGPDGVRTLDPYYDRVLALGDLSWTDYEATTTIKFHSFPVSPVPGPPYAQMPLFALLMRWQGHHIDDDQPHTEWRPLGSIAMLRKTYSNPDNVCWYSQGDRGIKSKETEGRKIELNKLYEVKMRVETLPGPRSRYSVKIWSKGQPEPSDWDLVSEEGADDYQSGSLLIVVHHADVTIGNVLVKPLTPERSK